MMTVRETKTMKDFSFNPSPTFYEAYNKNFLSVWFDIDYVSVLIQTAIEYLTFYTKDINSLIREAFKKHIRINDDSNFIMEV